MAELAALDLLLLAALKAAESRPAVVADVALGTMEQDAAAKRRLLTADLVVREHGHYRVTAAGDAMLADLRREMARQHAPD